LARPFHTKPFFLGKTFHLNLCVALQAEEVEAKTMLRAVKNNCLSPTMDTARSHPQLHTDHLFAQVYERLKAIAGRRLAGQSGNTLQTTALVHELFLRIGRGSDLHFEHTAQFYTYAARAMRHFLVDRARNRLSLAGGGHWERITLTGQNAELAIDSAEQTLTLHEALQRLEAEDQRAAQVVELLYFAGMTLEEAAQTLGVTRRTVDRDWSFARAFLKTELS
jgi:RNA polymerase sigma factor (TIGR02999 family)